MGNITIIGGTPASSGNTGGSSSLAIGQTVQAVSGAGLLPLDGQVYTKAAYPELHAQLSAGTPLMSIVGGNLGDTGVLSASLARYIAYSDTLKMHVAIPRFSVAGTIVISKDDGLNWQPVNIPGPAVTLLHVISDGNVFVIITSTSTIISTDGYTWTNSSPLPVTLTSVNSVNMINGTFAASVTATTSTGNVSLFMSSSNGINWAIRGIPLATVSKVIKVGSKYIAIPGTAGASQIATSPDCFTWTLVNLPDTDLLISIAATAARVCIVGQNKVFTSTDGGTTWTVKANSYGVVSVLNTFVASDTLFVLSATFAGVTAVYKTVDCDTWTKLTVGAGASASTITYTGTKYIMPVSGANAVLMSSNLIDWTAKQLPMSSDWGLCIWTGAKLVLIPNLGTTSLMSSDNGETWSIASTTVPPAATARLRWAANATNTRFVMTSSGSTSTICSSVDAITWTTQTLPSAGTWMYVAAKDSTFVVCTNAATASSTDGLTWVARTNAASGEVVSNGTTFVSALITGTVQAFPVATSTDGITWQARSTPVSVAPSSFSYNGSVFMIMTNLTGVIYASVDGITWVNKGASTPLVGYSVVPNFVFNGVSTAIMLLVVGIANYIAVNSADSTGLLWSLRPIPLRLTSGWKVSFGASKTAIIGMVGPLLFTYSDVAGDFVASTLPTPKDNSAYASYTPIAYSDNTFVTSSTGAFANGLPTVIMSADNGTTWTSIRTPVINPSMVNYVNGKIVLTGSTGIYTTNDNITWTLTKATNIVSSGVGDSSMAVWFHNVSTQSQLTMYTTDGMTVKGNAPKGTTVSCASSSTITLAVDTAELSKSTDNGASWTYPASPGTTMQFVAYQPAFDTFFIVASSSTAGYYTNNGGQNWSIRQTSAASQTRIGFLTYGNMLYLVSSNGVNSYSMNGGYSWIDNTPIASVSIVFCAVGNNNLVMSGASTPQGTYFVKKAFDETTSFQLPVVTTPVGSPAWFVKAK